MKLPCNNEAEKSILGACMLDNGIVQDVIESVTLDDFYSVRHKDIFQAIQKLHKGKLDIDSMTVSGTVSKELMVYTLEVADSVPTAVNYKSYIKMLKAATARRILITEAQQIQEQAADLDSDIDEVLTTAQKSILSLSLSKEIPLKTTKDLSKTLFASLRDGAGLKGIGTGFDHLNKVLGGLRPGKLIILAARPGMGKTALSKNIAEYVAKKSGPVLIASLEMDAEQLAMRHISGLSRVNGDKFNTGRFEDDDYSKLTRALGEFSELPILYDDSGYQTDTSIMARGRRVKAEKGLSLIIIDYIQLVRAGEKSKSREETVASISRNFKAMAKELQVPVLCLAQLNRDCEREKRRPMLADLRESGGIEQDADAVIFIHREHKYDPAKPEDEAEVIIAKNRDGRVGSIQLTWNGQYTNFYTREGL